MRALRLKVCTSSEEQRRPGGAKARPLRGFAHKGTAAVLPGLAVEWLRRCAGRLGMALSQTPSICALVDRNAIRANRWRLCISRLGLPLTRLGRSETSARSGAGHAGRGLWPGRSISYGIDQESGGAIWPAHCPTYGTGLLPRPRKATYLVCDVSKACWQCRFQLPSIPHYRFHADCLSLR